MASVEAGRNPESPWSTNMATSTAHPPHGLAGILLKEHDEDLDRLGGFLASAAAPRTTSQNQRAMLVALDAVAGRRDGLGWTVGWHREPDGYRPRGAYFIPGIVYLADAVGTQTETSAIRGLSGRRDRPHRPPRRAHRPARRLPSRGRDAAPHQLAVARSRTT